MTNPWQAQSNLFDQERVHARRSDPSTSDRALKAITNDKSLSADIWRWAKYYRDMLRAPFNDTQLTEYIEIDRGERQQRNVIARARGILEDGGLLRQAGVYEFRGRPLMHYEIDPDNPKENPQ